MTRSSRGGSSIGSDEGGDAREETPATPVMNCGASKKALVDKIAGKALVGGQPESVAASVPRDWNWSTF